MSKKDKLMQFAADAAVIGAAGAVSVAATDYVFDEYSKMVGYSRGGAQAGLHLALGAGVAYVGAPKVGAGIAIGGIVSGVEDAIMWARASEAQRNAIKAAQEARIALRRASNQTTPPAITPPAIGPGASQGLYSGRPRMAVSNG